MHKPTPSADWFECHYILLGKDVELIIVEGQANLHLHRLPAEHQGPRRLAHQGGGVGLAETFSRLWHSTFVEIAPYGQWKRPTPAGLLHSFRIAQERRGDAGHGLAEHPPAIYSDRISSRKKQELGGLMCSTSIRGAMSSAHRDFSVPTITFKSSRKSRRFLSSKSHINITAAV
jgi:hypothetical protein